MRTRIPATGLPCWETFIVRRLRLPNKMTSAKQPPLCSTPPSERMAPSRRSRRLPCCWPSPSHLVRDRGGRVRDRPGRMALVMSVIVTDVPTGMFPSWQLMSAPPVAAPVRSPPRRSSSQPGVDRPRSTPVAPSGPLLVTTIVQVTSVAESCGVRRRLLRDLDVHLSVPAAAAAAAAGARRSCW